MSEASRVDERDTMFARMAREPGTREYENYYARRPEYRGADDHLRDLPPLFAEGGRCYDPDVCGEASRLFAAIDTLHIDAVLVEDWKHRLGDATGLKTGGPTAIGLKTGGPTATAALKEMARQLGAVDAGCAAVAPAFVYTHKGRFSKDYGTPVPLDCPSAIVFLVEMDFDEMQRAPRAGVLRESARQYLRAARIGKTIEAALASAGWRARAQYDAHYDVMLVPLAIAAGLGELGRNNLLVAHRFGSRVRIGAVTTDCPLDGDRPVSIGVDRFCETCRKCADNCPSRALEAGSKQDVRGVRKWPTGVERCYGYWRAVGTDCGICMAACPFSHRDTWFHNLVRWCVRSKPDLDRAALFFDDLVYGRKWKRAPADRA
jgi:reductive dehalogenase